MISTRDLSMLPDMDGLRRTLQSMAMLDAVLSPEWEYRFYSFNAAWDVGEQMGSMRDGCGDEFFAHFGPVGCWIKGFVHDSPMSPYRESPPRIWPGVFDGVPAEFAECLREPAFSVDDVTFCLWRRHDDRQWQMGPVALPREYADPDGSATLLSALDGRPETYCDWASEYYERTLDLAAIRYVFEHRPLTQEVVARLNPDASLVELAGDIREVGYPGSM